MAMFGLQSAATTEWQQMCLPSFKPAAKSAVYHYTLDLGLLAGAVFVDDFSLAAVDAFPRSAMQPPAANDADYCNQTNVAARINTYRKGNFSIQFVKKSTKKKKQQHALAGTRLASLKLRLAMHDFPFGSSMEWSSVSSANLSWYLDTAKKHFNALVPENGFKWPNYEPTQGNFSDKYNYIMINHINFSTTNDFVLARGHTLEMYDVFNEVLHKLDFIQNCPGMWPGILYDGFRWAAAADPTAQLCLNDYGLVTGDDWPQFVQLAYVNGWTPGRRTPRYMKPRFEALAALNLSMVITEYNFWTSWNISGPAWAGTESEHAALHDEGFWDGRSWIKNGGIYYLNGTAKASANTVSKLWSSTWNTTVSETNFVLPSTALYGPYNGFYGKYYYEVMIGARRYSGYVSFPATGGAEQTATVYI
ncbi:hypothetical protein PLESTM_000791600 [Pleodorina starrii]|nr:hypothetical protein PLESTM_000791600 [Pleodorina starrii]